MRSLSEYIAEAKSGQTSLSTKISSIKKKIKDIDKLLKTDHAAPTAAKSRIEYIELLKGYQTVEKYLLNKQKMYSTRSSSEFDKLTKLNKKIISDISSQFNVDNPWPIIKEYENEYE